MSDNLSEQQFAQYSAQEKPHPVYQYEYHPMPSTLERHAPGQYQPTLPGMEHMLPGEQVHTSVFWPKGRMPHEDDEPVGSNWSPMRKEHEVENVAPQDLRPIQEWINDRELHEPHGRAQNVQYSSFPRDRMPLVEKIGNQRAIMDGHHRAARAMLKGAPQVKVRRWDA